jgi:hypothetical protein
MIRLGWCRNVINRQILRVKHVFRWAVENELLDAKVYEALRAVAGLREGKTPARETAPVKPVDEQHAESIFDHLAQGDIEPPVRRWDALVHVQQPHATRCRRTAWTRLAASLQGIL